MEIETLRLQEQLEEVGPHVTSMASHGLVSSFPTGFIKVKQWQAKIFETHAQSMGMQLT